MKKNILLSVLILGVLAILSVVYASITFARCDYPFAANRQGCCSHHGGVCGCGGGRAICCDGSYSPSCGCN